MTKKHPVDYHMYKQYLPQIVGAPDYVGLNPADNSIEYVKEIKIPNSNDYVKVAVRVAVSGKYYARSLYRLNKNRVNNFINKGKLVKIKH